MIERIEVSAFITISNGKQNKKITSEHNDTRFPTFPLGVPSFLHFSHTTGYAGHSFSWCVCKIIKQNNNVKFSSTKVALSENLGLTLGYFQ